MATREEFKALAGARLAESIALLHAGLWSGAFYLAGYAVECGLKAIIARRFLADAIPSRSLVLKVHTHNLRELVSAALLDDDFLIRTRRPAFRGNWLAVSGWSEASRYAIFTEEAATRLVSAVGDPDDGVLSWLTTHW